LDLHGRSAERSVVTTLLDAARASRSGVLVIWGPAGVGKSALLEDSAHAASDAQVLRASGVQSESELAFAALHQLLRPVMRFQSGLPAHQARALRVATGIEPGHGGDRFLVAVAALGVLSEAAEESLVLCLIDDAHWLDDASATVLLFVARRLEAERVVVMFAARDDSEGGPGFRAEGLPELRLAGLDRETAAALVEKRAGTSVSGEVCDRLVEGTAGNPLALLELSSVLTPGQLSGSEPLPARLPLSRDVERVFAERTGWLPEQTRTALLVAAAEETGRLATVIAAAAALGAAGEALDEAERAGLVSVRDDVLEFRHPLIRAAVYQAAAASERRRAHRALARVLESGGDADRRAWHLAAAAVGPDEDVVRALEDTAERARGRGGFEAACAALERAAELSAAPAARCRLLVSAAHNAWLVGEFSRVVRLLQAARPVASEPLLRADIGQLRGWLEISVGSPAAAQRFLTGAATDAAPVDTALARRILAAAAEAAWLTTDPDAGAELARIGVGLGPTGDPHDRLFADQLAGFLRFLDGDVASAVQLLKGTIDLAERLNEPGPLALAAHHALYVGDDDVAYRLNSQVVAHARAAGAVTDLLFSLSRLVQAELVTGRWTAAAASAAEAVRLARETGRPELAALPMAWLMLIAAWRGEEDVFDARVVEADEIAAAHALGIFQLAVQDVVRWARAVQKIATARPASAVALLEQLDHPVVAAMASLDRIEAAVQAGRRRDAQRSLKLLEAFANASAAPWALARMAHCHGLLSDGALAQARFEEALDHHERARRPFEQARTRLAYGAHLRRARRRVDARGHLTAALDAFETLGAEPWAERARIELRACGLTARERDPPRLQNLTPQEVQVARFVGRGLSTREVAAQLFLSPRTIDFHLRNVFSKLGISSRSELARLRLD
jgi:DNA-binding CsgD family transcriptional regulator